MEWISENEFETLKCQLQQTYSQNKGDCEFEGLELGDSSSDIGYEDSAGLVEAIVGGAGSKEVGRTDVVVDGGSQDFGKSDVKSNRKVLVPAETSTMTAGLNIKRFKCDYCPKVLKSKNGKMGHERLHTGEKPFKCTLCPKRFVRKSTLLYHSREHNNKCLQVPISCGICQRTFAREGLLKAHMKTHTAKKCETVIVTNSPVYKDTIVGSRWSYTCTVCNHAYILRSDRIAHVCQHPRYKDGLLVIGFAPLNVLSAQYLSPAGERPSEGGQACPQQKHFFVRWEAQKHRGCNCKACNLVYYYKYLLQSCLIKKQPITAELNEMMTHVHKVRERGNGTQTIKFHDPWASVDITLYYSISNRPSLPISPPCNSAFSTVTTATQPAVKQNSTVLLPKFILVPRSSDQMISPNLPLEIQQVTECSPSSSPS